MCSIFVWGISSNNHAYGLKCEVMVRIRVLVRYVWYELCLGLEHPNRLIELYFSLNKPSLEIGNSEKFLKIGSIIFEILHYTYILKFLG